MEPEFGTQMLNYPFMDASPTMIRLLSDSLRDLLLREEPRISEVEVEVDPAAKDGCLLLSIRYAVANSSTRDNLVFPFYLNAAPEEEP